MTVTYVFVTFQYGVSDQMWYLIVSNSDLCRLLYFQITLTLEMSFIPSLTDGFKPRPDTGHLGGPKSTPSNNVVCFRSLFDVEHISPCR